MERIASVACHGWNVRRRLMMCQAVREVLQRLVSGYQPAEEIVDWITVVGRA